MNLIGEKVILRAMELEDMEFLRTIINDPETEKNVVGWSFAVSKFEQQKWYENQILNKNNMRFIIEAEGKAIGIATLTNIDWKNRKAYHGIKLFGEDIKRKGYGTDAINAVMKYAFEELQLNKLYGSILEYNIASIKVYEKCGWKKAGILRQSVFKNNKYHNEILVEILKNEYEELKQK